jgi:hypothetical protein
VDDEGTWLSQEVRTCLSEEDRRGVQGAGEGEGEGEGEFRCEGRVVRPEGACWL